MDWPVTQPTGDEGMLVGVVATAAVEIVAAPETAPATDLEAGAGTRRPDDANPLRGATTFAAAGFGAAADSGALIALRAVVLFEGRAEEADGLLELCAVAPESPESDVSAHAAPAPTRMATPIPRPTAKPPMRPTYAEAFFVELITSPLGIELTVPHLANLMAHSRHESCKQIPRSSGCEKPGRVCDHGSRGPNVGES